MSEGRNVVILLSDPSGIDLEWILPLIDEFKLAGFSPCVIDCTPPVQTAASQYWRRALRWVLGKEPMRLVDFEPLTGLLARGLERLLFTSSRPLNLLSALYFSPKSPLFGWRSRILQRNLSAVMDRSIALFVGLREQDWVSDSYEGRILASAKASGVQVVAYPSVVDAEIPLKSMMNCDLALATTEQQAIGWRRICSWKVQALTPPKLTGRWVRRLREINEAVGIAPPIPASRRTALLVLKNDSSIVWSGLDFFETTGEVIQALIGEGYFVLLKAHPRQTQGGLDRLLAAFSSDHYAVVEGPLTLWASRADRVVSLFSGGVVDILGGGKVAVMYWPIRDLAPADVADAPGAHVYYRPETGGHFSTKYQDLTIEVTSRPFRLPHDPQAEAGIWSRFADLFPPAEDCRALIDVLIEGHGLRRFHAVAAQ